MTGRREGRRNLLLDDLNEKRSWWNLKEDTPYRTIWRTGFGRRYGTVTRQITLWMKEQSMAILGRKVLAASYQIWRSHRVKHNWHFYLSVCLSGTVFGLSVTGYAQGAEFFSRIGHCTGVTERMLLQASFRFRSCNEEISENKRLQNPAEIYLLSAGYFRHQACTYQ